MADPELEKLVTEIVDTCSPRELGELLDGLERAGEVIKADTEAAWKARGGRPQ